MGRHLRTVTHEGSYWFSADYAADLLHTTPRKIEALATTGQLRAREDRAALWIAEADVTALRRDPAALKAMKATVREKRIAPKSGPAKRPKATRTTKAVPHTIEPTAPAVVIDPFNHRPAAQNVLPWTTDRPGFAQARPRREEN